MQSYDQYWDELESWLIEKGCDNLKISRLMNLFGSIAEEPNHPVNVCLLITRFFIWYCRCTKTEPQFHALEHYLRFYLKSIKIAYYIQGRSEAYCTLWAKFTRWIEAKE